MTRVLVIDDSATMRQLIRRTLSADPQIQVVGEAADPIEARAAIKVLNPDVLTLDIEMPRMNGLDFLERLMRLRPTPVIMVSALTRAGAAATLQALELGAVDCVAKLSASDTHGFDELAAKVRAAHHARLTPLSHRSPAGAAAPPPSTTYVSDGRVVALGASTGGVEALIEVLRHWPRNGPPTLVVQHMPAGFTENFAARLDRLCAAQVCEARDGETIGIGQVRLAPGGGAHLELSGAAKAPRCRLVSADAVNGHRPSVDVLFASVARVMGPLAVGAIMTGMGRDGAQGLRAMRDAGADTLGQDEASSVIYGMPKVAADVGAVARQLPLERIGPALLALTHRAGDRLQ